MNVNDEEYFESIKNLFDVLPHLFASKAALGLTNTEELSLSSESINESAARLLDYAKKL